MNTIIWLVLLLVLGLAIGRIVGMLTAFTGGPAVYDLVAGGLGALTGGVLLRSLGSVGFRSPLVTLIGGTGAALLAAWMTRIASWPVEPDLRRPDDAAPNAARQRTRHDVMTTGEATAILLTNGRLVAPRESEADAVV